jgi:hypothetical protein
MVPQERLDIRLIEAHGNRDYRKIYDILKDLLNARSYEALANYMYSYSGHSIFFVEAVAFHNDRPKFDIVYNIALQVETDPNILVALKANRNAWDNCKDVYLRATKEYLASPKENSVQKYRSTCPDLKYIY